MRASSRRCQNRHRKCGRRQPRRYQWKSHQSCDNRSRSPEIADGAAASDRKCSTRDGSSRCCTEQLDAHAEDETRQAVVVPLARTPIKPESASVPFTPSEDAALMHTLRVAAARGAATVYVVAQSKPMIRVDGEIGPLESEPMLTAADVDRLVMELAPPRRRDALQNGPVEWLCDVPEIGRVRCHDVPGSPRAGHPLPDVPAARDLGRSARPDAGSAGALPAVRRARARRPARGRAASRRCSTRSSISSTARAATM